jgi:hypothetical protein
VTNALEFVALGEASKAMAPVTRETSPAKIQDLLQSLYVLLNTINERSLMRQNLHHPKSSLVVTMTLKFVDKSRM